MASHLVPLRGLCKLDVLQALEHNLSVELFESTTMRAVVSALWQRLCWQVYFQLFLFVLLLVNFTQFSVSCVGGGTCSKFDSKQIDHFLLGRIFVCSFINGWFLCKELLVMFSWARGYFSDMWNWLQLATHSLILASVVCFLVEVDATTQRVLGSCAVLNLHLSFLYFLKSFKSISFLVEMLVQILLDMLPFSVVLFIVLLGVTFAMNILVNGLGIIEDDQYNAEKYWRFNWALFNVLRIAEGRLDIEDPGLEEEPLEKMFYFLFVFLLFFISIVSLNALIALMGSTYERVMEKKIAER